MKTVNDTFTASEVATIAEVKTETLRVWRRRGHFTLDGERQGWTRFTFGDVLKISTFRTLLDSFVDRQLAEVVAANCLKHYGAILASKDADEESPYLICGRGPDGSVIFEPVKGVVEASSKWLELTSPSAPVLIMVDFLSILHRVMHRLNSMNEASK